MNTYLISDTHFSHTRIIAYAARPFYKDGYGINDLKQYLGSTVGKKPEIKVIDEIVDIKKHDQTIIDNWNSKVKSNDVVYHLGDFSFGNEESIVKKLNGKITFIMGNHDKNIIQYQYLFDKFYKDPPLNRGFIINNYSVILSHYPLLSWNKAYYGSLHFFGHVHSSPYKVFPCAKNSYDVGVDANGYSPIDIEEAAEKARNNPSALKIDLEELRKDGGL